MGLFSKDSKKEDKKKGASKNSNKNSDEPPELPKLPELPDMESSSASSGKSQKEKTSESSEPLPKLPSYPNSSAGDKFSQNSIKQAVSGEKEGENADEFESEAAPEPTGGEQGQMMPKSPAQGNYEMEKHTSGAEQPETREMGERQFQRTQRPPKQKPSNEPVFIRIDKFEDSLNSFDKIKDEISEVEELLKDAKDTKQEEDKELKSWEEKMQKMKDKISKIDSDIFSKV